MARRNESILDILAVLPWWVSVVFSAIAYIFLAFVVPSIAIENMFFQGIKQAVPQIAPYIAFILLIPAPISAINSWRKRQLLENQNNIHSIRALGWKEFEELVAEAYRRKGFKVMENNILGPDGGIDIRLEMNGHVHLVQCKQWRSQKVGVSIVREMFGIMTSENASSVIVITSGIFTQEAKNFADGKPIDLIDGSQLESLIGQVQAKKENITPQHTDIPPQCPRCNGQLVVRTARKGLNAGSRFYGCSSYPKCRYTQAYSG